MGTLVDGVAVAFVATSVTVYFSITAVIFCRFVLEEPSLRRSLAMPLLPLFLQNIGIPVGIVAFALRSQGLGLMAVALLGLGLLASEFDAADLHPKIETPLLFMALGSFVLVGAANLLA
jgi:hypothetical protein